MRHLIRISAVQNMQPLSYINILKQLDLIPPKLQMDSSKMRMESLFSIQRAKWWSNWIDAYIRDWPKYTMIAHLKRNHYRAAGSLISIQAHHSSFLINKPGLENGPYDMCKQLRLISAYESAQLNKTILLASATHAGYKKQKLSWLNGKPANQRLCRIDT